MAALPEPHEYIEEVCGVYFRGYCLEKRGTPFHQHSHDYEHATLIATGALRVWVDGEHIGDFVAPKAIKIEAKKMHKFQALADGTRFYCIHNLEGEPYRILRFNKGDI